MNRCKTQRLHRLWWRPRKPARRRSFERCLAAETFEDRVLLSATVGLSAEMPQAAELCEHSSDPTFEVDENGVAWLGGTHNDDRISIYRDNDLIYFNVDEIVFAASNSLVTQIYVDAKCGDDWVRVADNVRQPTQLDGARGNDVLFAGGGSSVMLGGSGNDWIVGSARDDVIRAGAGNDYIEAGDGAD